MSCTAGCDASNDPLLPLPLFLRGELRADFRPVMTGELRVPARPATR